jgi:hypothetical protein
LLVFVAPQLMHWVTTSFASAFHGRNANRAPHLVCVRLVITCVAFTGSLPPRCQPQLWERPKTHERRGKARSAFSAAEAHPGIGGGGDALAACCRECLRHGVMAYRGAAPRSTLGPPLAQTLGEPDLKVLEVVVLEVSWGVPKGLGGC